DVGAVRCGDQDDVRLDVEAVHLDEQLVERLLALVVPTAEPGTTVAADGVDLVDEDDARRVLLGLVEQVAHAAGADADEHLDELRPADAEERHAGLTGHRFAEQRLAGARRAHQQHTLGDARSDRRELVRVLDRKSTRLNSSHLVISYAVFCLKKKTHIVVSTSQRCGAEVMRLTPISQRWSRAGTSHLHGILCFYVFSQHASGVIVYRVLLVPS